MKADDFLLLIILAIGMIWINWNTVKRDFFFRSSTKSKKPSAPKMPSIEVHNELPAQL